MAEIEYPEVENALRFLAEKGLYLWRMSETRRVDGEETVLDGWGFARSRSAAEMWTYGATVVDAIEKTLEGIHWRATRERDENRTKQALSQRELDKTTELMRALN
jgi:hypothetical protein